MRNKAIGQVFFHLLHTRQYHQGLSSAYEVYLQVFAHSLNVAYVAHVYADSLVLVLQKKRVVVGRGTLFGSLVQERVLPFHAFGSCIQFCLSEGFQQVVYRFHLIAFHGIVAIRSGKHHQRFHFQRAHEVEPAHIGHIYIYEMASTACFCISSFASMAF